MVDIVSSRCLCTVVHLVYVQFSRVRIRLIETVLIKYLFLCCASDLYAVISYTSPVGSPELTPPWIPRSHQVSACTSALNKLDRGELFIVTYIILSLQFCSVECFKLWHNLRTKMKFYLVQTILTLRPVWWSIHCPHLFSILNRPYFTIVTKCTTWTKLCI